MVDEIQPDITTLTVQLLSAFVSNNSFPAEGLPDLIKSTRAALTAAPEASGEAVASETYVPAVTVRKSLSSPDHIISLIDGKPYKTLKRHLTTHGLTTEQYRERYNLPKSYPMVAPSYSEARRAVAAKTGLGQRSAKVAPDEPAPAPAGKAATPANASKDNEVAKESIAAAPASKQAPKAKSARTASQAADRLVAAPVEAQPTKAKGRKRLSIALSQEKVPAIAPVEAPATVENGPAAKATSPAAKPKNAPKQKAGAATKPTSRKPATKAKSATSGKDGTQQASPDASSDQVSKSE